MSNQYVGELRLVSFSFAPVGWALAQGQILPISQNTALFSLLGTYYGGNGTSTFALPNMQGNVAVGVGQGPGLSPYAIGETGGSQYVTLLDSEVPNHTHNFQANKDNADQTGPGGNVLAKTTGTSYIYAPQGTAKANLTPQFLTNFGGSLPHNNMQPYLTLNWLIAMQGVYPPRN